MIGYFLYNTLLMVLLWCQHLQEHLESMVKFNFESSKIKSMGVDVVIFLINSTIFCVFTISPNPQMIFTG